MIQTTVALPFLFRFVQLKRSYIRIKKVIVWHRGNILHLRLNLNLTLSIQTFVCFEYFPHFWPARGSKVSMVLNLKKIDVSANADVNTLISTVVIRSA